MPRDRSRDGKGKIEAELAPGGVAFAISEQYPGLSVEACYEIENILMERITAAIRSGRQIGILEERPDGSVAISVMVIEEVIEQVAKRR
ncbi:hypothetical protein GCM10022267_03720 [Lentzea roselyniae]|uniref:Uncharacterized protein n=1 Tax=Lentzea roselyniae TaxID=531940 RepID=A0ABP6ZX01_9PSEU